MHLLLSTKQIFACRIGDLINGIRFAISSLVGELELLS